MFTTLATFESVFTMSPRSSLDKEEALGHVENLDGVPQVIEIDGFRVLGISSEDADFYKNYSEEKRKKVLRKVSDQKACWASWSGKPAP